MVGGDETLALKLYSDLFAKPSLRDIYVYITLLIQTPTFTLGLGLITLKEDLRFHR